MQETAPNRLDEPTSLLVSPFGQPRDSHRRGTADSYAPQMRIVKGDVPVSSRSPSPRRSVAPARTTCHPGPRHTVALRLGAEIDSLSERLSLAATRRRAARRGGYYLRRSRGRCVAPSRLHAPVLSRP